MVRDQKAPESIGYKKADASRDLAATLFLAYSACVIILSLLHPIKQVPVQLWTFPQESVIRIGRATDNQVILYSAVVSRRHVELRRTGLTWEVTNLGTNGTYLDGKRISQTTLTDGAVIRLARSGPNIQVRIGEAAYREMLETMPATLMGHQRLPEEPALQTEITSRPGLEEASELDDSKIEPTEVSFDLDNF